jgi:sulfofructose kinase
MEKIDVLVIGRSCLDYISVVNEFPLENQKTDLVFRMTEGGGQGGTAACCVARLGGRTTYVGKLGDDEAGRFCLKRLQDFGVATDWVEIVPKGITPVAYIFVTRATGDRTIIYEHNALPRIKMDPVIENLLNRSSVVLLDPETTYWGKWLDERKVANPAIVYDCERWRKGIEEIMAVADFFIPTAEFLKSPELYFDNFSFGDQIIRLKGMIKGMLIVTAGSQGAYYVKDGSLFQVSPPSIKAVDTIGAGDNFHAAFSLAVCRGFDLDQAVKFSVAVASLSCRDYGGRKGVPDWEEAMSVAGDLKIISW